MPVAVFPASSREVGRFHVPNPTRAATKACQAKKLRADSLTPVYFNSNPTLPTLVPITRFSLAFPNSLNNTFLPDLASERRSYTRKGVPILVLDYKDNFGPRPRGQLPGGFDRSYFQRPRKRSDCPAASHLKQSRQFRAGTYAINSCGTQAHLRSPRLAG